MATNKSLHPRGNDGLPGGGRRADDGRVLLVNLPQHALLPLVQLPAGREAGQRGEPGLDWVASSWGNEHREGGRREALLTREYRSKHACIRAERIERERERETQQQTKQQVCRMRIKYMMTS